MKRVRSIDEIQELRKHLHLCVLTNRESNADVHLNNNYCFRCRLPNVADAKSLDRCIRQFDDLLLKFHRLEVGKGKEKKSFSIEHKSSSGLAKATSSLSALTSLSLCSDDRHRRQLVDWADPSVASSSRARFDNTECT